VATTHKEFSEASWSESTTHAQAGAFIFTTTGTALKHETNTSRAPTARGAMAAAARHWRSLLISVAAANDVRNGQLQPALLPPLFVGFLGLLFFFEMNMKRSKNETENT
jgi:hypothetical protein